MLMKEDAAVGGWLELYSLGAVDEAYGGESWWCGGGRD